MPHIVQGFLSGLGFILATVAANYLLPVLLPFVVIGAIFYALWWGLGRFRIQVGSKGGTASSDEVQRFIDRARRGRQLQTKTKIKAFCLLASVLLVAGMTMMLVPSSGCGDFDIDKVRPEWRDEVYRGWRACMAIEAQRMARAKCDTRSWFGLAGEDRCPAGMP